MFKRTYKVEEEFIKRRIEEDKALRATAKAKAGKVEEKEEEAEDEGSSHDRSKCTPQRTLLGTILPGMSPSGLKPYTPRQQRPRKKTELRWRSSPARSGSQ